MFEQSMLPRSRTRRPWTFAVALVGQLGLVALAVLIPLLYIEPLPLQQLKSVLLAPPPPPPPPPPKAAQMKIHEVRRLAPRQFVAGRLFEPSSIPKHAAILKESPLPEPSSSFGVVGGIPGGVAGGVIGGLTAQVLQNFGTQQLPPPPPVAKAPPPPPAPKLVRVGGDLQQARLVYKVAPTYPLLARSARLQGTVVLDAIIGRNGDVQQLQVIQGPPLLRRAAVEAVKQWRYEPTLLNGDPVKVETTINITFRLA